MSEKTVVGVRSLTTTKFKAPLRVYYPGARDEGKKPASWFRSIADVGEGYAHSLLLSQERWSFRLVRPLARGLTWLVFGRLGLPDCQEDVKSGKVKHLIVWSHGLMGTGDEHALLASALARRLNAVVGVVQHTDGSSAYVAEKGMYFRRSYPGRERDQGCITRADEVDDAIETLRKEFPSCEKIAIGGFSFGAATSAVVASRRNDLTCACLVDGSYCATDDTLVFDMPTAATTLQLPVAVMRSNAFKEDPVRAAATDRFIAHKCPHLDSFTDFPDSFHGNFTELVFWLPPTLATASGFCSPSIADPRAFYNTYLNLVIAFFDRHLNSL